MAIAAADKVVHGNDLTYITQQYKNYFQAKESGKSLSTNDYTTEEKTKLAGIDASADVNVIETVKLNGTALTPDANKAVNVQALPISGGTATGAIKVKYGSLMGFSEVDNVGVVVSNGAMPSSGSTKITQSQLNHNKITVTNGNGDFDLAFPAKAGTIALTSDIPDGSDYVPLAGGTMDTGASLGFVKGTYSDNTTEIEGGKIAVRHLMLPSTDPADASAITLDPNGNDPTVTVSLGESDMRAAYGMTSIVHRRNNTNYTLSFPTRTGTIALTEDIMPPSAILNDSQLTGTPVAPTASAGTNTTQVATTAFVTTAVNNAIGSVTGLSFNTDYSTYAAMAATTGSAGVIYLIPNSGTSPNSYDEYFWNGSGYEKFGTTDVDLSGYVQTSALETLTTSEITTLLNL